MIDWRGAIVPGILDHCSLTYLFAKFALDQSKVELTRNGEIVPLEPQVFALLLLLVAHSDRAVSKQEIVDVVWNGRPIYDSALASRMKMLRKALGDDGQRQQLIKTVRGHGYRFVAPVVHRQSSPAPAQVGAPVEAENQLPRIAVLAFDDLSQGPDKGFLSDAIAEGITTELAHFDEISVLARNSSFRYRGKPFDVRDIAKDHQVHFVLEGSQQKNGDDVRIIAQLINAQSSEHMWSQTLDRTLADGFETQNEIIGIIAASVGFQVAFNLSGGNLAGLSGAMRCNIESRPYIRQLTPQSLAKARALNLKAIALEPDAAWGYCGLAIGTFIQYGCGWPGNDQAELLASGIENAEIALNLAPQDYSCHYARACGHIQSNEIELALLRCERALVLNPQALHVHAQKAELLVFLGDAKRAVELMDSVIARNARYPEYFLARLAFALWHTADYERGLASMQKMAVVATQNRRVLAALFAKLDRLDEAREALADFLSEHGTHTLELEREIDEQKFSNPARFDDWIDSLRAAGMPS